MNHKRHERYLETTWENMSLSELLYAYRSANMCIMEKHHSEYKKDLYRLRATNLHKLIIERYGDE